MHLALAATAATSNGYRSPGGHAGCREVHNAVERQLAYPLPVDSEVHAVVPVHVRPQRIGWNGTYSRTFRSCRKMQYAESVLADSRRAQLLGLNDRHRIDAGAVAPWNRLSFASASVRRLTTSLLDFSFLSSTILWLLRTP
jgi:hypothetical protein